MARDASALPGGVKTMRSLGSITLLAASDLLVVLPVGPGILKQYD
jgi:hypothetical protein